RVRRSRRDPRAGPRDVSCDLLHSLALSPRIAAEIGATKAFDAVNSRTAPSLLFRKVTTVLLFGCSIPPRSSRFPGMKPMGRPGPLYPNKIQGWVAVAKRSINRNKKKKT